MTIAEIQSLASENTGISIAIAVFGLAAIVSAIKRFPVFSAYAAIALIALAFSLRTGGLSYFLAFMLGVATAFAEIIEKFRDEPLKAFRAPQAVAYHTLNGCISVFALFVLRLNQVPFESELEKMNAVLLAGVGSMLVMRSRLFNVKVGNEDMAFGPEQIINIYLRYMERAIDRVRAQSRIDFVRKWMKNLDFGPIRDYTHTMLDSAQALSIERRQTIETAMEKIGNDGPENSQLKSYKLGFLLLTEMGEDFLLQVFERPRVEWQIAAPGPERRPEGWWRILPLQESEPEPEEVLLFSYGSSIDEPTFLAKLGWKDAEAQEYVANNARKATLPGYRLAFNKPSKDGEPREGWPNIVKDQNGTVRGVLYRLPERSFEHYALNAEPGYEPRLVRVTPEGDSEEPIDAFAFVAIDTEEGLVPAQERVHMLRQAVMERELGNDYERSLEELGGKAS